MYILLCNISHRYLLLDKAFVKCFTFHRCVYLSKDLTSLQRRAVHQLICVGGTVARHQRLQWLLMIYQITDDEAAVNYKWVISDNGAVCDNSYAVEAATTVSRV